MSNKIEWREIPSFPGYKISSRSEVKDSKGETLQSFANPRSDDMYAWVNLWFEGNQCSEPIVYLFDLAFPEKVMTEEEWLDNQKDILSKALGEVYTKLVCDNYGLKDQVITAMVERVVKEGWHPDGGCE